MKINLVASKKDENYVCHDSEFIEKPVQVTPAQRCHLVRWGGVFASASPYRKKHVTEIDTELDKENLYVFSGWSL